MYLHMYIHTVLYFDLFVSLNPEKCTHFTKTIHYIFTNLHTVCTVCIHKKINTTVRNH